LHGKVQPPQRCAHASCPRAQAAAAGGEAAELETLDALFEEERAPKVRLAPRRAAAAGWV
jgi:hypothetical protein